MVALCIDLSFIVSAAAEFLLGQTTAPTANQTAEGNQAPLPKATANGAAAIPAAVPQRAKTANA